MVGALAVAALVLTACGTAVPADTPIAAPTSTTPPTTPATTVDPSTTAAPSAPKHPTTHPPTTAQTAAPSLASRSSPVATTRLAPSPTSPFPTDTSPTVASCPLPTTGFSCAEQDDITSAGRSLAHRPGTTGIVLRDRQTGAVWANSYASTMVWTASTIKLAMVVDLFTRAGRGQINLTPQDRTEIRAMLHSSDDNAADALWYRYAGPDHSTWNTDFPAYGLTDLTPQRGFSRYYPYWGFQKTTPDDLDRLIHYVLTNLDPTDRAYVVDQLQHVAPDQQWGVWGSGPGLTPGNKDGWSLEQGGWVINSVGFVGPGQRWTLAMMSSLNGQGGYTDGVATLNAVAATITAGLS